MLPYCFASAAPFLQNSCFRFVNSHPKMLQTHHSQQPLSNHDIHNRTPQTCCIMHPQAFHLFERLIKHIVSAQKKQRTSNHQKHHDPPLMQQHCHLSTTASPWLLNSSSSLLHKHTVTWANHNKQTWWPLFLLPRFHASWTWLDVLANSIAKVLLSLTHDAQISLHTSKSNQTIGCWQNRRHHGSKGRLLQTTAVASSIHKCSSTFATGLGFRVEDLGTGLGFTALKELMNAYMSDWMIGMTAWSTKWANYSINERH